MTGKEIREVVECGKALGHPLRMEILALVATAEPISPAEMYKTHKLAPLGVVSYHTNTLAELGCVSVHGTRPRRGTVEHFWKLTERGHHVLLIAKAIVDPTIIKSEGDGERQPSEGVVEVDEEGKPAPER